MVSIKRSRRRDKKVISSSGRRSPRALCVAGSRFVEVMQHVARAAGRHVLVRAADELPPGPLARPAQREERAAIAHAALRGELGHEVGVRNEVEQLAAYRRDEAAGGEAGQ